MTDTSEARTVSVTITFAGPNDLGVLDQDVEVGLGDVVHVPLRVVPNGG